MTWFFTLDGAWSLRRDSDNALVGACYKNASGWHCVGWLAPGRWGHVCPVVKTIEKKAKAVVREWVEGRG